MTIPTTKILIVDDDVFVREMLSSILEAIVFSFNLPVLSGDSVSSNMD